MKKQYIHPVIEVQASMCNNIICVSGGGSLGISVGVLNYNDNPQGGDVGSAF